MERLALIAAVVVLALVPGAVGATHQAEDVSIIEAHAFENLLESGDLLFLARFELPEATWRDSEYMSDTSCTDTPSFDETDACFTSIEPGAALLTAWDDTRATGALVGVADAPRIHHGLGGIYLQAGHGLTFGAPDYELCIEGSSTLFSSISGSCLALSWHPSSDMQDGIDVLEPQIVQIMLNLEDDWPQPLETYVQGDVITERGDIYAEEAFSRMRDAAPGAFELSASQQFSDVDVSATEGAFESVVSSDASGSTFTSNFSALASGLFGLPANIAGGTLIMVLAMVAMAWASRKTGSATTGVLMGSVVVLGGMFQDLVPYGMVFSAISVVMVVGGAWLFARMP